MHETGLDSRPPTALPGSLASVARGSTAVESGRRVAPALMLPPRLGVLRRPVEASPALITRLVVPVPLSDMDEALFGRLVWQLAAAAGVGVLLLAKVGQAEEELPIRRRLTTLAALLRRPQSPVETAVVYQSNWIRALRQVGRTGDLVVCPSEESYRGRPEHRTLAGQVVSELGLPAYLLDGFRLELAGPPWIRGRGALAWAAALAVLAGFGWIQVEIVTQTQGWLQTLLLAATVGLEMSSLLAAEAVVGSWR